MTAATTTVTYVTAFFEYKSTPHFMGEPQQHQHIPNPNHIHELISTGINLCVFIPIGCSHTDLFFQWSREYPNFKIMSMLIPESYKDTHIYCDLLNKGQGQGQGQGQGLIEPQSLPDLRNGAKDTMEHLIWTHYKIFLFETAAYFDPFSTDNFVWIDSNISAMFSSKTQTFAYMAKMSDHLVSIYSSRDARSVFFPGCLSCPVDDIDSQGNMFVRIFWRFCGGFVAGKREAILAFCSDYLRELYASFMESGCRITWDVNFLAYLEKKQIGSAENQDRNWIMTWYHADHNDSIVKINEGLPFAFLKKGPIANIKGAITKTLKFPNIPGFIAGSTAAAFYRGQIVTNTRYINYELANGGSNYIFFTDDYTIRNKNVARIQSDSNSSADSGPTVIDIIMSDTPLAIDGCPLSNANSEWANTKRISYGLEDIRLYTTSDRSGDLKFIATNVDYSPVMGNRMIIGKYCYEEGQFRDCIVALPPNPASGCEKNWAPIQIKSKYGTMIGDLFVYGWWPYQVGEMDAVTGQLNIVLEMQLDDQIFRGTRGSSPFVYDGDKHEYIGVVHFSVSNAEGKRQYYHYLVTLDENTLLPKTKSEVFFFFEHSIEFCVGFQKTGTTYQFWASRMDKNPIFVEIPKSGLVFNSLL